MVRIASGGPELVPFPSESEPGPFTLREGSLLRRRPRPLLLGWLEAALSEIANGRGSSRLDHLIDLRFAPVIDAFQKFWR